MLFFNSQTLIPSAPAPESVVDHDQTAIAFVPPLAKKFPFGEMERLMTGPVLPSSVVSRRERLDIKFKRRAKNMMMVVGENIKA